MNKTTAYAFAFARKRSIEALALLYQTPTGLVTAIYERDFKTKPMMDLRQCRNFPEAYAWLKEKAGTLVRFTRPLSGDDIRRIADAWKTKRVVERFFKAARTARKGGKKP